MKIDDYLKLPYTIEIIRDEDCGGWFARVVELPGCLTSADSFEELGGMIQDAMYSWIEAALEDGIPIPEPRREEIYSGKFVVRVPRSLHRELAEAAEHEGVSLNAMVNQAITRGLYKKEVEIKDVPRELVDWQRLSPRAHQVLAGVGLKSEAREIDESLFSEWLANAVCNIRAAVENNDLHNVKKPLHRMSYCFEKVGPESPLFSSLNEVVSLMKIMVEKLQSQTKYQQYQSRPQIIREHVDENYFAKSVPAADENITKIFLNLLNGNRE